MYFFFLQDRSLDFHALCALYAVTGTGVIGFVFYSFIYLFNTSIFYHFNNVWKTWLVHWLFWHFKESYMFWMVPGK